MNVSRIIGLVVAVAAGGVALFLAMEQPEEPPVNVVTQVATATVRVLVSEKNIERGERLKSSKIGWVDWPKEAVSGNFLTADEVDEKDFSEAIARRPFVKGEPIIEAKLARAGDSGMMATLLQPGMRAVTTRINVETGAGGFILPGDHVDIYRTQISNITGATSLDVLLEDVKILAIDDNFTQSNKKPHIAGATATIELSPKDAEHFMLAQSSNGTITLVLRSVFEPEVSIKTRRRRGVDAIRYGRS